MPRTEAVLALALVLTTTVDSFSLHSSGFHLKSFNERHHAAARSLKPGLMLTMQSKTPSKLERSSNLADQVADCRAMTAVPSMPIAALLLLAPTAASAAGPEWLEPTRLTLDISLLIFSTLFFIRIPMTWYPQMDLNQFPQNLAAWPTEPILKVVRGITPPLFGVDISPIVVYAVLSFIREIFLGQQGVFTLLATKADL